MKQKAAVNGYAGAVWTGVTTITLAEAVHSALTQNLTGLYHLVNNDTISKLELLKLFNVIRTNPVEIVPSDAVRENKSLVNTRTDFDFTVLSYAQMVSEMGDWLKKHAELYPHYA
jgi:dTDP-4-dehydrorhamnose reductase